MEFAGDITMIEYGDGARRYIPYRHAFGITRRQYGSLSPDEYRQSLGLNE